MGSCLDLGSPPNRLPPFVRTDTSILFDSNRWIEESGLRGFVFCGGVERRDRPLKEGWSHNLPVGDSVLDVVFSLVSSVVLAGGRLVRGGGRSEG